MENLHDETGDNINTLFSIGHSNQKMKKFVELLKKNDITTVLDVRSKPYSKHSQQFNKEKIKSELEKVNIAYKFMGEVFGARQKDKSLYSPEGYLDFEKVKNSPKFLESVAKIIEKISNGENLSLMCSEKEPINCHRTILIAKAFYDKEIDIKHILIDGNIISQSKIEEKLLILYNFPHETQSSLDSFKNTEKSNNMDYIQKAYEMKNKEIANHLD